MSIEAPEALPAGQLVDEPHDSPIPAGSSILDHLHQRRTELVAEQDAFELVEVPMWKGALAIRFEYPDGGADAILNAVVRAQQSNDSQTLFDANLSVLVACCAGVMGRQPGGEWQPLDPEDPRPLRFNERLAGLLQITVPDLKGKNPAKTICRHVFSPRAESTGKYEGDISLLRVADQVITFLSTGQASADARLVGE